MENNQRIDDYEAVLGLLKHTGYSVYLKHLNKKYELLRKEAELPEGNKDFLTGKLSGVRLAIDLVATIIREGEIEKEQIQNKENNKE